jgi:hypothetical protein
MYDEKLNKSSVSIMLLAPVFYCTFGYWMLSNKQIFGNTIDYTETLMEPQYLEHNLSSIFNNIGFPTILLFFAIVPILIVFFKKFFFKVFLKCFCFKQYSEKEGLSNYFEALSYGNRYDWLMEEKRCRS